MDTSINIPKELYMMLDVKSADRGLSIEDYVSYLLQDSGKA